MMFWGKRKRTAISKPSTLSIEQLEVRNLMAVIPLVSGQAISFNDADGTLVTVKLKGPGEGSIELVGGVLSGAAIDTLSLMGTTGASKLKISARGGSEKGTTINQLVIEKALGEVAALGRFKGRKVDFADDGEFTADGDVANIHIRSLGEDATVDVDGNVDRFKARTIDVDATIAVSGVLQKFVAQLLESGSGISADQVDMLKVKQHAHGATIEVGEGGLAKARIGILDNSTISSDGGMGEIVIKGDAMRSALASNINKGSDDVFGTMDDFVVDHSAAGNINTVKFRGNVGAPGTSDEFKIVTSGVIGRVYMSQQAQQENHNPTIWTQAASQFVALSILQGTENVPTGRTATGYGDSEIYIAIYGSQIPTPPPGTTPVAKNYTTYYLDPTKLQGTIPVAQNTKTLQPSAATPNQAILPSFTIEQWKDTTGEKIWGSNLAFPAPQPGYEWTGRILISVGAPVQAQVDSLNGTVSAPSAADLSDPSTGTFYDFLEFTVTNPNSPTAVFPNNLAPPSIDIDTSLVDSFGIPMRLQLFKDAAATLPYNVPFTGTLTTGSKTITGVTNLNDLVKNKALGKGQPLTSTTANAIPSGATITGYSISNSTITMSLAATASGSAPITAYVGGPVGVETTRQDVLSSTASDSLLQFLQQKIAGGTAGAQAFLESAAAYAKTAAVPNTAGSVPSPGPIVITTASTTGLFTNDVVQISGVTADTAANGLFTVTVVDGMTFTLNSTTNNGMAITDGNWTAYTSSGRLVSPKDIVEALTSPQSTDQLNNYFNEAIDDFFVYYSPTGTPTTSASPGNQTFSLQSTAYNGTLLTYSGHVELDTTYNAYALTLNETTNTDTTTYKIYYPFFANNLPSGYTPQLSVAGTTPPWISAKMWDEQSPSQMIFACDAVFADNVPRKAYDMNPSTTPQGAIVLGDLENSLSAAFSRGIYLNSGLQWSDVSQWFPSGGTYNYWVEYWHKQVDTYNDLAYAFPYDDKFGASTNLNLSGVGLTQITLGSWSASAAATTTTFTSIPTSAGATSTVTLTAQVAGSSPTGTVTFFIDGVAINPNDTTAPPLAPVAINGSGIATITATLPALPSGTAAATYTVTAVYSGDANNLPSVAATSLPITEVVNVSLTDPSGVLGSSAEITTVTPGTQFTGNLTYTISLSDGSRTNTLASNVATTTQNTVNSYPIPTDILKFTGTASGTNMITGISNMTDLMVGQVVSGTGVPTGAAITGLGASSITLDQVVPAGTIELTSNANGASLPIAVSFTPSGSMTPSASGSTNFTVTAAIYAFAVTPGSGALGSTPTLTVTFPGTPYNGTVEFMISRPDGTDVQSMGSVAVDSSTLSSGNQVVVTNVAIPSDLLTFTAYPNGTNVIQGISTVSGWVPGQTITGTGVPSDTTLSNWAPASLVLMNTPDSSASTSPTAPETLTASNGVTFTGWFSTGTATFNVISVDGWDNTMDLAGISISGTGVGTGNTIDSFTPGTATLSNIVTASSTAITFTSSAENSAYPITAIWTPTNGSPLPSQPVMFAVT